MENNMKHVESIDPNTLACGGIDIDIQAQNMHVNIQKFSTQTWKDMNPSIQACEDSDIGIGAQNMHTKRVDLSKT